MLQLSPLCKQLIGLIPQVIWFANDQGEILYVNLVWQRYTNQPPETALKQQFFQFFHAEEQIQLDVLWQTAISRQTSFQKKVRFRMGDGSYEWFSLVVQPIQETPIEASDDSIRWLGSMNRLAGAFEEEPLLVGQEFLEALFENISDGLVACNSEGQLVLFNRAAQEFHNLPPEPISGDLWSQHYDLYDGQGQSILRPEEVPLMRAFQGEKVRGAEMMIIPKGEVGRSLIANADPIYDASGQQLGAVVLMRNVTDRKQIEAELRAMTIELEDRVAARTAELSATLAQQAQQKQQLQEREARFRATFEQAAMGLAHVDLEGRWLRVNRKLCEIVGYEYEELLQKTFQDITHPDDLNEDLNYVKQLLAGNINNYSLNKRYIRKDGSNIWVRITVALRREQMIQDGTDLKVLGKPLYFIGVVEDISDRKQLEIQEAESRQALETAKQVLEQRNYELDQFVHIASHDLKAPLRGISNLSSWIEEDLDGQIPAENQQQLALLRQRVKRMEHLINGLLQYARVGREQIEPEWVNTQELLLEVIDSIAPAETFRIQLPDTLPTIMAKRLLLSQVFTNLLSNAIKHHNLAQGIIKIDWQERNKYDVFSVTDDGPGIPSDQQERIFRIFQTLGNGDSTRNTGIGLALIKKIIEAEGGEIRLLEACNQDVGDRTGADLGITNRGCCFEFTWPKYVEPEQTER